LKSAVLLALLIPAIALLPAAAAAAETPPTRVGKNIIVMIADGSGLNHMTATSYYAYGTERGSVLAQFSYVLGMTTHSADGHPFGYDPKLAWSDFDWVRNKHSDSAAAATAMACGVKTYYGAIGLDVNGNRVQNALELAESKGKATGVVSTVQWSHATPGAHVAHNAYREDYEEIALEMVFESAADVVMGAGHPWYDDNGKRKTTPNTFKYVGGEKTWNALLAGRAGGDADGDGDDDPWTLIQTREQFRALMTGPTPRRVLGTAQIFTTMNQSRSGDGKADPYVVPRIETVPTLAEMSLAALNVLDDDPDGLYLMIEGGAVDWAAHSNQSGRMIEESLDFERATQAVIEWVETNSNWTETLLIVTGDHETGYLTGPNSGHGPVWNPIVNKGKGVVPGMEWNSTSHTNSLMIFAAKGAAARMFLPYATGYDPVFRRYIDNTNIKDVVFALLNGQ
jgi:alkaline phosphatase